MTTWWQESVFYQIYPRSFMDSDRDGVGDLQGIFDRLDYLVELGIDALWISPIFPSPMADFGYDISDYTGIHPLFGDMATFDRLLEAIHARGLKLILDYVPNHTSDEHPWFIESRSSRDNPKRNWYIWRDAAPDGGPPNNWESFFGGSAWEWDETTGQYYLHLFDRKQPDLNWRNPEVVATMHQVLHFWLDKGVDGFRMDVVTFLIKHKDMPDNPMEEGQNLFGEAQDRKQQHVYNINQPEIHAYMQGFRQIFDSYPGDRVIVGETWVGEDFRDLVAFYGREMDELHLPFNFSLLTALWDAELYRRKISDYYAALPAGATPNFVLGNHDFSRVATRYGIENHRSAGLLLLTLWGVPTVYNGEEIGMTDGEIPPDRVQDPAALNSGDVRLGRDPGRTPFQWDSSLNAGFTAPESEPWLPVNSNYPEVNAAAQENDESSTLHFYRTLLRLRHEMPVLHEKGTFTFLENMPDEVLVYVREKSGERVLIAINFVNRPASPDLSGTAERGIILLNTVQDKNNQEVDFTRPLALRPHEGMLIRI